MLPGQFAVGASVSFTVTVKLHDELFPAASVAVQVTVEVPTANVEPEAGLQDIVEPQLSVVVAL